MSVSLSLNQLIQSEFNKYCQDLFCSLKNEGHGQDGGGSGIQSCYNGPCEQ